MTDSTLYIGRVGLLAAALGVGAVLMASPGTAWADDGVSPGQSPSANSESRASSGGVTGARSVTADDADADPDDKAEAEAERELDQKRAKADAADAKAEAAANAEAEAAADEADDVAAQVKTEQAPPAQQPPAADTTPATVKTVALKTVSTPDPVPNPAPEGLPAEMALLGAARRPEGEQSAARTMSATFADPPIYETTEPRWQHDPVYTDPYEDGTVTGYVTAVAQDPDSRVYYSGSGETAKGTVIVDRDEGTFVYTPYTSARIAAGRQGAETAGDTFDTFVITGTDRYGQPAYQTVRVPISPIYSEEPNRAPVFIGGPSLAGPNGAGGYTGTVRGYDPEEDEVTFSGSITTNKGKVVVYENGTFTFTPTAAARHAAAALNASAADKVNVFTITMWDAHGGSSTMQVTVPIVPANAAPVPAGPAGAVTTGGGLATGTVKFTDLDGDPLTYLSGTRQTKEGTVTVNPDGSYIYTANRSLFSAFDFGTRTDAFTVTAIDGYGGRGTTTVNVTIPRLMPVATAAAAATNAAKGSDSAAQEHRKKAEADANAMKKQTEANKQADADRAKAIGEMVALQQQVALYLAAQQMAAMGTANLQAATTQPMPSPNALLGTAPASTVNTPTGTGAAGSTSLSAEMEKLKSGQMSPGSVSAAMNSKAEAEKAAMAAEMTKDMAGARNMAEHEAEVKALQNQMTSMTKSMTDFMKGIQQSDATMTRISGSMR